MTNLLFPTLASVLDYREFSSTLATAGQPTVEQFALLRDVGFETVINLAMPDSTGAVPDEDLVVEDLGMTYVPIPVRWQAPAKADLMRFFDTMDERNGRERLFVHCIANKRVSAFLYLYRVLREGWAEPEARVHLQAVWTPNDWWQSFLTERLSDGDLRS